MTAPCRAFVFVSALIPAFGVTSAIAQDFPARPIRLIVPDSPGTNVDLVARIVGPEMSKGLGQPIVVENRPGASQTVGLEYVAKQAPADGYTVVAVTVPNLAILPLLVKDLRFDPMKDLPPVVGLVETRLFFGSASQLPWTSFNDLVANAKANPGRLNWGAPVPVVRLQTEALIRGLGVNAVFIPYASAGQYVNAILAAEIHMAFIGEAGGTAFGEKFRVLAVTGEQRHPRHPAVPTFAELGFPQIRGVANSLNVRAGTPAAAIDKLYAAAARALRQPEVKALFDKSRYNIVEETPAIAGKRLAEEASLFENVAKQVGIQPQ